MPHKDLVLKVNILQNRYVTDGNIWTVDETFFSKEISLFIVLNLKTKAILGYIIGHQPVTDNYIIELYSSILDNYNECQNPIIVHSDLAPEYTSPKVQEFCKKHNIELSVSSGDKHQNQVSESINDKIKALTILELINKDTRGLRALIKAQPSAFKGISKTHKSRSKEYRNWFFQNHYFQSQAFQAIEKAISQYNNQDFTLGITRDQAEFYNTKIKGKRLNEAHLVKSNNAFANCIKNTNIQDFKEVEIQLTNILNADTDTPEKLLRIEQLLIDGQNTTQELLKLGFSGLALQNQELIANNKQLSDQLNDIQNKFEIVVKELTFMKTEREERKANKEARAKRKRMPRRQPLTPEIYQLLIHQVSDKNYCSARLRIAFCLLAVTGVRISELLPLKVSQIQTLLQSGWISINRAKRGPSSHKAFLTPEGKRIVKERIQDFEIILFSKNEESYIFSPQNNHNQMLRRESITRLVNNVMLKISSTLPNQPNLTSHSFRAGYITQLWKDTQDIEFVKQAIGHTKVESTSSYIELLSDEERLQRMLHVKEPKDLVFSKDIQFS